MGKKKRYINHEGKVVREIPFMNGETGKIHSMVFTKLGFRWLPWGTSQAYRVLAFLLEHEEMDSFQARAHCGAGRLSDVIMKLRRGGWEIDTIEHTSENEFAEYTYCTYKIVLKKPSWNSS